MSTLDGYKAVMKEIQSGKVGPIYVLHGEEGFFIDRVEREIVDRVLEDHERDFNLTVLYGRDCDAQAVKDACLRYPMMAERQVVVLREAQAWRPDQWDKLEPYAEKPTPTTVLVIAHKHKKMDGRKGFPKTVAKKGTVFHSEPLRDHELPKWIQAYVQHHKRKIGQHEALLLADHLGSDLGKTAMEVEKLALITPEGSNITTDTIQRYVGISKDYNIFELQKAIGARDHLKAQRIAHYFANDPKDHPLVLTLGLLNGWFGKVAMLHGMRGKPDSEVAATLKIPPFFVKEYAQAAQNFDPRAVVNAQNVLRSTDLKSKGVGNTSAGEGELLREAIARILS
ncbi:MAG: DNA polymerase III subunit delta [Flavobacteriales bacterium]|nr:MAG: DNA polymerase III subunit delta [Flavobacteriales bacterium]